MSEFDDLEIRQDDVETLGDSQAGREERQKPRLAGVLVAFVVLAVVGFVLFRLLSKEPPKAVPESDAEPAHAASPPSPPAVNTPSPLPFPSLADSDPYVRALVRSLSARPEFVAWLANDELVRRFTLVVCNVAFDENPSVHVDFLRPAERFSVEGGARGARIAEAGYRRFDLLTEVFVSFDAAGSVAAYRKLRPLMIEVYEELGYPGSFDAALLQAIDRLLLVPKVAPDLQVREKVVSWELVDPELEALSDAQKQLLRMGPTNVARVQNKLRELRAAL